MPVTPYLFFDGRCEEALDFYKTALGAEIETMTRFKDAPESPPSEGCADIDNAKFADKIMHAAFVVSGSTIMASDGFARGKTRFAGFSLSFEARDEAEAGKIFSALSDGGKVQMPLGKAFFARSFGIVTDRFGIDWMVIAV
jgi:PhnB protein